MASTLGKYIRFTELTEVTTIGANDEVVIVDKSDVSSSPEGTDVKVTVQNFLEQAPVRPSGDPSDVKTLTKWIDQWNNKIRFLENVTQYATTSSVGVVELATDIQATDKASTTAVITASNFAAMDSTHAFAGLVALATGLETSTGTDDSKAVTPLSLFEGILGASLFGNDTFVFKFPVKDSSDDKKREIIIQYAEVQAASVYNTADPSSSFNHIHSYFDLNVTFPQAMPNKTLMVIPVGYEVDPANYHEGTDFFIRAIEQNTGGAKLRATRIGGVNTNAEKLGVRYLVIGF